MACDRIPAIKDQFLIAKVLARKPMARTRFFKGRALIILELSRQSRRHFFTEKLCLKRDDLLQIAQG